jgi:hypothetical protein
MGGAFPTSRSEPARGFTPVTTDEGVTIFVNPVQVAYVADEAEMPRGRTDGG